MNTAHPATVSAQLVDELLAAAPATRAADEQIVASGSGFEPARRDELDAFGLAGRYFPVLSVDAQAELAASWQWVRRANEALTTVTGPSRGRLQRELDRRGAHLEFLLGSVFRLARDVVAERINDPALISDALSECWLIAIDAAATFDTAKNPSFANYYTKLLRKRLTTAVARFDGANSTPDTWVRLWPDIVEAQNRLSTEFGEAPTTAQITALVIELRTAKTRATILETQPELTEDEIAAEIVARHTKYGITRAFGEIAEIRERMRHPLDIDAPHGEDGLTLGDTLHDGIDPTAEFAVAATEGQIAEVTRAVLVHLDPETAKAVLARLTGNGSDDDETPSVSTVGRAMRRLRAVTRAPHAHWCVLALEEADLVEAPLSAAAALAAAAQ